MDLVRAVELLKKARGCVLTNKVSPVPFRLSVPFVKVFWCVAWCFCFCCLAEGYSASPINCLHGNARTHDDMHDVVALCAHQGFREGLIRFALKNNRILAD